MGQEDVIRVLKEWKLAREVGAMTGFSLSAVFRCLKILEREGEIEKRKAHEVIKERDRLKNVLKHVFAYKVRTRQGDLKKLINEKIERDNIAAITSKKLRTLPVKPFNKLDDKPKI